MEKTPKTVQESVTVTHDIVHPGDANSYGIAFGGYLMGLLDKAACIAARRHCGGKVTTVGIDGVRFFRPAAVGAILDIKASINRVFNSSMEIGVKVTATPLEQTETFDVCHAYMTFAALDSNGKPTGIAPVIPETDEEKRRFEEAQIRRESRKKLKALYTGANTSPQKQ
jgi:acyl-CoA hydrolase